MIVAPPPPIPETCVHPPVLKAPPLSVEALKAMAAEHKRYCDHPELWDRPPPVIVVRPHPDRTTPLAFQGSVVA